MNKKKIVNLQDKRNIKEGYTPIDNMLQDVSEKKDQLDIVLVLARSSDGDFKMWTSGDDKDSDQWVLIMEVCKNRVINGYFN